MSDYDFSGLTANQQWLLTMQGWSLADASIDNVQPSPRTVRKLIDRGLLIEHRVLNRGMVFREYHVPLPVHAAWCAHCAARDTNAPSRRGNERAG